TGNLVSKKKHFSGLNFNPACHSLKKTCLRSSKCSLKDFDLILISLT
ncbi:1446_t:CDS:1, partial [Funneliformis geosporum]